MRKTLSTEAAATRRSTSKSLGKISLLLAGSPRHRVRVRVLHFKEEKIFYPRGMVDNHDVVAEGNRVAAHFTITGRHVGNWGAVPPTGKLLRYEEMAIFHFKEEKIFYQRGVVDNLRALYQAGSDAPEENPPSPRTNPEVTKLQQNL